MRSVSGLLLIPIAAPALAHPGHVAESAGHSHWLALMAIAAALVIAGAGLLRLFGRRHAAEASERAE